MKKHGQTLIEFALILPLLLLVITMIFDVGRAVFDHAVLNNAVREGTRYAVVQTNGGSDANIISKIKSYYFNDKEFNDSNPQFQITRFNDPTTGYPKVQVLLTYRFSFLTPGVQRLLGLAVGGPVTIKAQSEMYLVQYVQ